MSLTIAINGFGRIGRTFLRTVLLDSEARKQLNVVAINVGPKPVCNLDLLFAYDSIMGAFPLPVKATDTTLTVGDHTIALLHEADPSACNWQQFNIDWVVEASGTFTDPAKAQQHLAAGAKRVLITAPADGDCVTIIPGVNDATYNADKDHIISLGSCTTNCFAPLVKVLHENFIITNGLMTTMHSYTNDQVLLDVEHKDPRRARAAALNMIPTKTGASKVIGLLFPELASCMHAVSIRVPTPCVSLVDFSFTTQKPLSVAAINNVLQQAAHGPLAGIMTYTDLPLVSSDFTGNPASCVVDSLLTQSTPTMGKVFAWYDNEFGYSCRLRDFLLHNR